MIKMTVDVARKKLETFIDNKTIDNELIRLPVFDEVVFREKDHGRISSWTFRGLLKVAYGLADKQKAPD